MRWELNLVSLTVAPTSIPALHENLLARGATIGRFVVLGLVGNGGMGEVYAAYDPGAGSQGRDQAAARAAGRSGDPPEGRTRLMREAQAIARVSHPNVVVVYDVGTFEDHVFIAMEFVEGHTLRLLAARAARAPGRRCWRSSPRRAAAWPPRTSASSSTATSSPTT